MLNNGTSSSKHHLLGPQIDSFKSGVRKMVDRVSTTPTGEPTRIRRFADTATAFIKDHPIATIAAAFGLGYLVTRIARR